MAALVSVIIPAFNAERFVGDAIESVLEQEYSPVECIVVDDGSSDGTTERVQRYARVRCVSQENLGVAAARNRGASLAGGDLLAFLDADDVWAPSRLARQVPLIANGAPAVLSAATAVDQDLKPRGIFRTRPVPTPESLLLWHGTVSGVGSTLLVRRQSFEEAGRFDERLTTSADWDLLLRLVSREAIDYVDEPLALCRVHDGGMSRTARSVDAMEHDLDIAYREAFVRSPQLRRIRRRAYARMHWVLGRSYYGSGERWRAARHTLSALTYDPRIVVRF